MLLLVRNYLEIQSGEFWVYIESRSVSRRSPCFLQHKETTLCLAAIFLFVHTQKTVWLITNSAPLQHLETRWKDVFPYLMLFAEVCAYIGCSLSPFVMSQRKSFTSGAAWSFAHITHSSAKRSFEFKATDPKTWHLEKYKNIFEQKAQTKWYLCWKIN